MAWTVAFALLGALLFALLIAPVLCTLLFKDGIRNGATLCCPSCKNVTAAPSMVLRSSGTSGTGVAALAIMLYFAFGGIVGSEFCLTLTRGRSGFAENSGAQHVCRSASIGLANRARVVMARFPEVKQVVSQVGRPDDGTDASGFLYLTFLSICCRVLPGDRSSKPKKT